MEICADIVGRTSRLVRAHPARTTGEPEPASAALALTVGAAHLSGTGHRKLSVILAPGRFLRRLARNPLFSRPRLGLGREAP